MCLAQDEIAPLLKAYTNLVKGRNKRFADLGSEVNKKCYSLLVRR